MTRLEIAGLSVALQGRGARVEALDAIDLTIGAGETVCLVGESGSGKTVTALSVLRLIDYAGGAITSGEIRFGGHDLARRTQEEMSALRGRRIGVVLQDPMTAFDPLFTIGSQITEAIRRHRRVGAADARRDAIALLRRTRIADPELRMDQLPHELSGGMRQRASIAMALACGPDLLIADEPTTALDVTIQAQILRLLQELQSETGMSVLLITHDLGVAAEIADRIVVMYAGRIVEDAPAADLFARPAHPYTRGLLRSIVGEAASPRAPLPAIPGSIPGLAALPTGCRFHPRCSRSSWRCLVEAPPLIETNAARVACWHPHEESLSLATSVAEPAPPHTVRPASVEPLIETVALSRHYPIGSARPGARRASLRAVDDVSFAITSGETFGLVGESGSGKSTLGRLLLRLERPDAGHVAFDGVDLARLGGRRLRQMRRDMQMIFQNPHGSVDPRWTVGEIVSEPLATHEWGTAAERRDKVAELLAEVGLDPALERAYPHRLSGGQCQRIAIARAIALRPRFIVADEAVSALDVSVRAQIVNLLQELKERLGLTMLFIGHGLDVVRHVSDRIGVMYLGRLVEIGPADTLFRHPAHPYTKALLAAIPKLDPRLRCGLAPIDGEIPSFVSPPSGCAFHPRCPAVTARCREETPALVPIGEDSRAVACHVSA
ncbi:ABC transporter ATP-binding protein [Methylosinus sp. Sm6]|uniref:dipeptide ABC transporter ATP-binding protein n=1 Tax=Methylosinus sp. Sm6 TaxID=2866948 RepID=UPI001C99E766|nr:ABC transporter ATP-binding protein [Methylosinus sp. Sm6]MBY6242624.1 ABC transporter ATP-binding protein [Methylosinus sp. Sm6]